jgi:hypothetical protein
MTATWKNTVSFIGLLMIGYAIGRVVLAWLNILPLVAAM